MTKRNVWIGEAYKDGERIERVVHKNERDCREDIRVTTSLEDPDEIIVESETLYLGEDKRWLIER